MKTKDVAFGGLMIALFLTIGFAFRGSVRVVQSYLEILKTIIVAVAIRNVSAKARLLFPIACLFAGLIVMPIYEVLVYNVPCVVGGVCIGVQKEGTKHIINFVVFFLINTIMIGYEIFMFGFFMQSNLFVIYQEQAADMMAAVTGAMVSELFVKIGFVIFILVDSAFSAAVIYILFQIIIRKLKKGSK